jgi:hypothetical protein
MTMMGSFWIETTTNFLAFRPFPAVLLKRLTSILFSLASKKLQI